MYVLLMEWSLLQYQFDPIYAFLRDCVFDQGQKCIICNTKLGISLIISCKLGTTSSLIYNAESELGALTYHLL